MTPQVKVRTILQGEVAARGNLYRESDCPYTPGSRRAELWRAGFRGVNSARTIHRGSGAALVSTGD